MMTISLVLIEPKIGNTEQRITGNTCGRQEYTDWPCLHEDGCIVFNEERSLKEYLLDKTINHRPTSESDQFHINPISSQQTH